jgi:hypothetical protein
VLLAAWQLLLPGRKRQMRKIGTIPSYLRRARPAVPAMTMTELSAEALTPRKKNRKWVWYFLLVLALSAVAVAIIIGYNLGQQLTADQLEAAMQTWRERQPAGYEFDYTVKRGDAKPDLYEIRVKDHKVVFGSLNGINIDVEKLENHSMWALLQDIKTFMDRDAEPGKAWTYTRARFDEQDGHLLWYVRRVMGSRERVEIEVKDYRPQK